MNQPLIDALETNMRYRDMVIMAIIKICEIAGKEPSCYLSQKLNFDARSKNSAKQVGEVTCYAKNGSELKFGGGEC